MVPLYRALVTFYTGCQSIVTMLLSAAVWPQYATESCRLRLGLHVRRKWKQLFTYLLRGYLYYTVI